MSARTLFGSVLVIAMLATTAFAEEQKDQRDNPKSPQYMEYAVLQRDYARAALTFPEYGAQIIDLLVMKNQADPAHATDEVKKALRDLEKLYTRGSRYEDRIVLRLNDKNLLNEPDKLAECRAYITKLTDCVKKLNDPWNILLGAIAAEQEKAADDWKAAADEVDKEDTMEKEREDKDKQEKK